MTIQDQINARDNPGPDARFCPHCGTEQGACIRWYGTQKKQPESVVWEAKCFGCGWTFTNNTIKRWGGQHDEART